MKNKMAIVPKLLALILSLMLILTAFPAAALDAEEETYAEIGTEADVTEYEQEADPDGIVPDDPDAESVEPASEAPTEEELAPVGGEPVDLATFTAVIYCEDAGEDEASRTVEKSFDDAGELTYEFVGDSYVYFYDAYNKRYLTADDATGNLCSFVSEGYMEDPALYHTMYVPKGKNKLTLTQRSDGYTFDLEYEAVKEPETTPEPTKPEPTDAPFVLPDGFYMIRPDWKVENIDTAEKLEKNPANDSEWMVKASLAENDEFKVVKVENNAIKTWYPDGSGNNYVVDDDHAGRREVYFSESYRSDWDDTDDPHDGNGNIYVDIATPEVEKDEAKPEIKDVNYSVNKTVVASDDAPEWVKYEDEVAAVVTVTDEDPSWGIDENSFTVNDNKVNVSKDNGKFVVPMASKKSVTIKVKDKARNQSDGFTTIGFKVDEKAPSAEDISKIVFSNPVESPVETILNALTFGLYSNQDVIMTVYVEDKGGSPITEINVIDENGGTLDTQGGVVYDDTAKAYKQSFVIKPKPKEGDDDSKQPYQLKVTTIKDKVYESTVNADVLKLPLYADSKKLEDKNKDLYELVNTLIKPYSEITVSGENNNNIYTSVNNALTFTANLSDVVSGIAEVDGVKAYVGTTDALKPDEGGIYNVAAAGVTELTFETSDVKHGELGEETGKLLSETISGTIPDDKTSATGTYRLVTVVKSNSNNVGYQASDFTVDNDVPEVSDIAVVFADNTATVVTDWTKETVKGKLTATDASGNVTVTAVGSVTGDTEYPVTEDGGFFYFTPDRKQDYTVTAKDTFGHTQTKTLSAEKVLFDDEKPVVSDVKYDGESYEASPWKQKETGVTVSFTVTDISEKVKDLWLSGEKQISVVAKAEDGSVYYSETKTGSEIADNCYTFSFVSTVYQKYTITATDYAGNDSAPVTTEKTKVDSGAPEITEVSFSAEPENGGAKILHFLTFGLYSDDVVVMTVKAKDDYVSSNIRSITAKYVSGQPVAPVKDSFKTTYQDQAATAEAKFKLDYFKAEDVRKGTVDPINGAGITVEVVDNAEYTTGERSLYDLQNDAAVNFVTDNGVRFDNGFEIAASNVEPTIEGISVTSSEGKEPYIADGKTWFPGNETVGFTVYENLTKLHSVSVTLNGQDISGFCEATIDGSTEALKPEYTNYKSGAVEKKVQKMTVSFDTASADINQYLRTTGLDGDVADTGKNEVKITAESNNGKQSTETTVFYVDDTRPEIKKIVFSDDSGEDFDDASGTELPNDVTKTEYGYYFQNTTTVTVTASDVGCGVQNIYVKAIPATSDYGTKGFNDGDDSADIPAEFIGDDVAQVTVPANFKGLIVAYAYDHVDNKSKYYSPDGLVVESEELHPTVSGAEIEILSASVGTDQDGTPLFNGSVDVRLTIYDLYSGLNDVTYSILDTSNSETHDTDAGHTVVGQTAVDDWTVTGRDSNIVTRITKVITVDANTHNDNGIKIELSGKDRAGFEIAKAEKTISIDITKPIIKLEYNPATPTATHNGENYYKETRTATITVTERNFNPDQIDWSKFVAVEGTRPAVVGVSNWSTSYALDTGSAAAGEQRGAVHTATITFSEDGKFEVDFDYTDLAGNAADKQFEKDTFYIDKTKPVMTVTLEKNSSPRYYQSNVATIKIVEHNFDPDSSHFTYTPTATGPDYASAGTAPQVGAWSTSGDEHTATIDFPGTNEGKFSFKVTFKDLAENQADDHDEPDFYIDSHADKPEFDEAKVKDHYAYDNLVTPAVTYTDHSFDTANYTYKLTRHAYDFEKMEQITDYPTYPASAVISKNSSTGLDNGARVDYENFPNQEIADGIYTLYAEYTDLAGNHADNSLTFSVNRFGSVFLLGNVETSNLVEREYTSEAPDVVIREISAIQHKDNSVSLSYNSSSKTLDDKANQYKVSSPNTVGKWYEYMYDVFADNFKNEGEYTVTVTSLYSIGGKDKDISNRTANTDGKVERNCPVSFVVDKTTPTVSISGVEDGQFYSEAEKTLQIICTDDNIDKDSLVVTLDGQNLDLEAYGATVNDDLFGEIDVDLPIAADGHETKHSIKVEVKDLAGNGSDNAINAFTLSATFLTMFFHNTVALIISGAVLAALIALGVVLAVKKRKKA